MTNDDLLAAYKNCPVSERYKFINKIKNYLKNRPDMKAYQSHGLYLEMIFHHLQFLKKELKGVAALEANMNDLTLDLSLNFLPYGTYTERNHFMKALAEYRQHLEDEIDTYAKELATRLDRRDNHDHELEN